MDSTRTIKKFDFIQDYVSKYRKLKENLIQSQNLNKQLKSQILKVGSEYNTVLISVTSIESNITELKSLLPKRQKQLLSAKQEQKRIQYKTQKIQIKQKQYTQRAKRFQQMYNLKNTKNQTLKQKIQRIELKLIQQKQTQNKLIAQLSLIEQTLNSNKQKDYLSIVRSYRSSVLINPCDQIQLNILANQTIYKKSRQQKEQYERRNIMLKSSINKIQIQIQTLKLFLQKNTSLPNFHYQSNNTIDQIIKNKNTLLPSSTTKSKLPSHILLSLTSFQQVKSNSMLQPLVQKHTKMSELENVYVQNLEENYLLITQLTEINKIIESQILQENSKISTFAIRGKKYTEKHRKSLA